MLDLFSSMWGELILASITAIIYFVFLSKRHGKKREKSAGSNATSLPNLGGHLGRVPKAKRSPDTISECSSNCGDDEASKVNKRIAMRANDIRSCGRNGNLNGAVKAFEKLGSDADSTLVLNSMINACVECQDQEKALEYFNRAKGLELADVISYNKIIKGYLFHGQEQEAKDLLNELLAKGIANIASYHGILNERVNTGDMRGAWKLITEMQTNGMHPNAVTCAILLKGKLNSVEAVSRVLALIDSMNVANSGETMDEVLFMAIAEACVRVGRLDMLSKQMEKFKRQGISVVLSAETYGSMIKAYGRARDTRKVWELWNQMVRDRTGLTSVTLGCMVEALVANGQSPEAWSLVKKLLKDEATRPLVNTVICSSILKGFAYTKDTDKVMLIYKEMLAHKIPPNKITYNTILNAFAQCGTMQYAQELLDSMKAATPPVEPDIVTYSTLVKGYCHCGSLDRALQVYREMTQEGTCKPDEVLFNSLLGGCSKEFHIDKALQLLDDMRTYGIAPSNYTLSMLVKLMCRCRRLDQAFTMLEGISKEYNFRINIQVYTCLIQGCFHHGQPDKAMAVYGKIMAEGLTPDAMTYTVLVRGCIRSGSTEEAVNLVKRAYGVEAAVKPNKDGSSPIGDDESKLLRTYRKNASPGLNVGCLDEVVAALGGDNSKQAMQLMRELDA